jgi:hypothetical protein
VTENCGSVKDLTIKLIGVANAGLSRFGIGDRHIVAAYCIEQRQLSAENAEEQPLSYSGLGLRYRSISGFAAPST